MITKIAVGFLVALVGVGGSLAQTSSDTESESSSSKPVAYVYVSRPTHIDGFGVSSSGKLTAVPGSPFANTNVNWLSLTKKFLFGEASGSDIITTFSINSNGSIAEVSSIDAAKDVQRTEFECSTYPHLQTDSTGEDVYYLEGLFSCANTGSYLTFGIESDGHLQYKGYSGGYSTGIDYNTQGNTAYLKMLGNNKFAYDSVCAEDNGNLPEIDIYKRESNGVLDYIAQSNTVPAPGSDGHPFCTGILATDSDNHLAVALQRIDEQFGDDGFLGGPYFLASYTADSTGKLTTKSTAENMPEATFVGDFAPSAISIDPTNKFVAVGAANGGATGFAIYHFNGSSPITKYSGVLQPSLGVTEFGWDKSHHLFVLGSGKLYVYTVTSSEIKEASGSPYSIPESMSVIVRDLQ